MLPSPAEGVPNAYLEFPKPYKSVKGAPAEGGPLKKISAFDITYSPPPLPMDQNKYWQELNKRIGATMQFNLTPENEYESKFSTLLAGGELGHVVMYRTYNTQATNAILQGAFTELTDYVSESALKDYPNLSGLASQNWKNSEVNGKLYGVPVPQAPYAGMKWRGDWAEKLGVSEISNADDYEQALKSFTFKDPDGDGSRDTWGCTVGYNDWDMEWYQNMWRVPYNWKLNKDGTLTNVIELPEYMEALAYAQKLHKEGVYVPGSNLHQLSANEPQDFDGGKVGSRIDVIGNVHTSYDTFMKTGKPEAANAVTMLVPPGHDGGKGVSRVRSGNYGAQLIPSKVGKDPEKVKEILRILDYYAAPFGSEEDVFLSYGIENRDFKFDDNGLPIQTDTGKKELTGVPRLASHMPAIFLAADPYLIKNGQVKEWTQKLQNLYKEYAAIGVYDPTTGYVSKTQASKGATLGQKQLDTLTAIVLGRKPLSDWDQFVKEWKQQGGDQITRELEQAMQQAKG